MYIDDVCIWYVYFNHRNHDMICHLLKFSRATSHWLQDAFEGAMWVRSSDDRVGGAERFGSVVQKGKYFCKLQEHENTINIFLYFCKLQWTWFIEMHEHQFEYTLMIYKFSRQQLQHSGHHPERVRSWWRARGLKQSLRVQSWGSQEAQEISLMKQHVQ